MLIQGVQNRAVEPAVTGSRAAGARPAAGADNGPADQVVVSEQARQLSARMAGSEGPELQLSPERLRELIQQVEEATTPSR